MKRLIFVMAVLALLCVGVAANAVTLDFEGLADYTPVTNQYAGVTFSGATVLTSGVSLNEFDYPPFSGINVVFDDGGSITGLFTAPVSDFGAYFTYSSPLTLKAWDASNSFLGSLTSTYNSNLALSGDSGSVPNEFLNLSFASGISRFEIAGGSGGGSFVMDDFQYTAGGSPAVPDASAWLLGATGLSTLWARRRWLSR